MMAFLHDSGYVTGAVCVFLHDFFYLRFIAEDFICDRKARDPEQNSSVSLRKNC